MGDMLEINTLSNPEIVVGDEKVVNFISRKALALVIYLAINPGNRSREELADLLWSDQSQERATGNLRVVLSDIRKKVGDYLSINRHTVSLLTNKDISVDVHQLLDAIETHNLDAAISLYKGDFLESFYLRGASGFENWQVLEREKIRLELIDGLSETIHQIMKVGRPKEAIKYLVNLTTMEPLLESAHRQLMQAYFDNGDITLALKQFEVCKQILSEELSVTPAEETLNLYAHIARNRSLETNNETVFHNLPIFTTPFIGQEEKNRELVSIISKPDVRHLSLVGPGGYGKSRLAIHLAKQMISQFPDGTFWIPLQSLDKSSELPIAIADAIGFIHQSKKDFKDELLNYLSSRQTLLILDNFEHLISGARLVSEILTTSQSVKIITTTRQKLNLHGETTYFMRGMDYPIGEELTSNVTKAKKFDAVQLFIKSARRSKPSFNPTKEDIETIARVCKLVDGMPLAIELAAGWVPVLSSREIEKEVRKGFDFLEGKVLDIEKRHQSLQAVAEGSWQMLTDAERSVFKRLSIFKGPFSRKAAENIAGAKIHDLLSLSNKSFLQKDSEGLLRVHEWLRQFGESELIKNKEEFSRVVELFSDYYLTYLSDSWWEAWSGECHRLRLEWKNISEAMLITARRGEFQLLRKGLVPFFFVSYVGEDFNKSNTVFIKLVAELEKRALSNTEHLTYALCLTLCTYFLETENKFEQIINTYDKVENLIRGHEQSSEYAWARVIENIANFNTDWKRMYKNATQALKIFINLKDDYAVVFTHNILASRSFGDMKKSHSQSALEMAKKNNGTRDIASALLELGRFEMENGDFKKAEEVLDKAYSRFTTIRSLDGMVNTSRYMGILAHKQGKYSQAKAFYEQAFELCNRAGFKSFVAECKELLGSVAIATQKYDLGRQLILDSITSWINSRGDMIPFEASPSEVAFLLEHLGYPGLAFIKITTAPEVPFGEMWKYQNEVLLEELKSRYTQEEIAKWTEMAGQIKPIELAIAIRDALSESKNYKSPLNS